MKWYKRDPDAFLAATRALSLEERGAYNDLLELLYSRNGNVPDDDQFMARNLVCRPQIWRRIKASLILKGKIHQTEGKLTANRVETTLKEAVNFSQTQSKRAKTGWVSRKKYNKNKEGHDAHSAIPSTTTTTTTTTEESSSKLHLEDLSSSRASAQESDLNNSKGREAKQTPYYAEFGAPELDAWDAYGRATTGKTYPRDKRGGWTFPSQWPPNGSAP